MRIEKRLDLVVTLENVALEDMERVGSKRENYALLKRDIPHVKLPVAPGRDMARLVETAALEYKLRSFGVNTAEDFSKKLLKFMLENRKGDTEIS